MFSMANRIKEIRKDRGLSQEQLADTVHTTKATISKLEKGQIQLSMDWMHKLATALECHWAEFAEDTPPQLTKDEAALLGLYRGLADHQKKYAHRLVHTLKEPTTDDDNGDNGDNGHNGNGTHKQKAG